MSLSALGEQALARLPAVIGVAPLHSNPGPEHVFVDPRTGEMTGLIDFGDAYISHPAFDLRWPRAADRADILAGYDGGGGIGDADTWQAVHIVSEIAALTASKSSDERREIA